MTFSPTAPTYAAAALYLAQALVFACRRNWLMAGAFTCWGVANVLLGIYTNR